VALVKTSGPSSVVSCLILLFRVARYEDLDGREMVYIHRPQKWIADPLTLPSASATHISLHVSHHCSPKSDFYHNQHSQVRSATADSLIRGFWG